MDKHVLRLLSRGLRLKDWSMADLEQAAWELEHKHKLLTAEIRRRAEVRRMEKQQLLDLAMEQAAEALGVGRPKVIPGAGEASNDVDTDIPF